MSSIDFQDVTGESFSISLPVTRVVSLVPSMTETLFEFGLEGCVVGRTRYCNQPMPKVKGVERVGGTKDPDLTRIIELAPDLILANKEENREQDVLYLRMAGLSVYVDEPKHPRDVCKNLKVLGEIFECQREASTVCQRIEDALNALGQQVGEAPPPKVVCLIWKDPWMAVGRDTYIGGMVDALGGRHSFSEADQRYFEIDARAIADAAPDIVLLPDEPFRFIEVHANELKEELANEGIEKMPRFLLCDGRDLCWHGVRAAGALVRLRDLFTI